MKMASMSIQRSSSQIASSSSFWKYDVFLSFRGEDTRKSFVDHLYNALKQGGINAFKDDKRLEKGKSISQELSKAIEDSKISIIVFSRNYASSTWCLDELVKIVQCMNTMKQIVMPLFYDVDPSEVRKQTGNFLEAFAKHEEAFREDARKVQNWRTTLTEVANLAGWDLRHRHESELIQDVVKEISSKLCPKTLRTLDDLVGMKSRLEKLRLLIGTEFDDVRMIGIYGMGGIGKTTIARAIYDLISYEFEGSSFLANVREISKKSGLVPLQKQLLSQILRDKDINVWDVHEGIIMIRSRLWHKKVFIIIDDVDDITQLDELIGEHSWFGPGSRIIITTRDKHLLTTHRVDKLYKVEELDDDEALQLFSSKAFKNNQPSKKYMELCKRVLRYTGGLPLALQVLGSFLFGRNIDEWQSALQRLGKDSEKRILDSLQISFDGLKETEKKIFLDVACFFKGKTKDHVIRILDGCDFNPTIGISVLVDKSLITITGNNELEMHDLLQEMGQRIVQSESFMEPGRRSRLWRKEDVHHVLTKNTGTEAIEGIILEEMVQVTVAKQIKHIIHQEMARVTVSAEVFSKMINLRLLKIHNVQLFEGLECLSNELRLLEWHRYPLKSLPSSVQLDKIVELKLPNSHIEELLMEIKPLNKLKVISLTHSKHLNKTPDFKQVPNLEELILEGCTSLREIHSSLLVHKKLVLLNLKDCTSLTTLPREINMESLKKLILSGCVKLKKFPEIVRNIECLSELSLEKTCIKELPFPVELLKGLVLLSLKDCKNLVSLPSDINGLKSLKTLILSGCCKLENVPEKLGQVESLEKLDLSATAIRQPVSSIFVLKNLKELSFFGCKGTLSNSWYSRFPFNLISRSSGHPMTLMLPSLSSLCSLTKLNLNNCSLAAIPSDIGSLVSLRQLYLRGNNFVSLPASINLLSKLHSLDLGGCRKLQSVPELPSNLDYVEVDNCISLESLSIALKSCQPKGISCLGCWKLRDYNNETFSILQGMPDPSIGEVDIIVLGSEIPKWFNHQNEGSSIRTKIHPDLKLKGYVVCAVFFVQELPPGLCKVRYFLLECQSNLILERVGIELKDNSGQGSADHLWLNYIPIPSNAWPPHDFYDVEFKFISSLDRGLEVKGCAVHPVYKQEVDEFNHPMDQCSSSAFGNLIKFHQDNFVTSRTDVATTKRNLDNHDGVEPTAIADFDNEPETKRLKNSNSFKHPQGLLIGN